MTQMVGVVTRLAAIEAPQGPAMPPTCRRAGCELPGVVATELVGHRRIWTLFHCEEHPDGPGLALQLGFRVLGTVA